MKGPVVDDDDVDDGGMKRKLSGFPDTTTELERTRIVAVDGEWRGNNALTHGILSLGWVIGRADRMEVLHKGRFNFAPMEYVTGKQTNDIDDFDCMEAIGPFLQTQDYEPRCLEEFWSKHSDKKAILESDPVNPMLAIALFKDIRDGLEEKGLMVLLVSDAPGRDFHFINTYLDHAGLPDINTTLGGKYRQVYSTEDYARGALGMGFDNLHLKDQEWIDQMGLPVDRNEHDHMPENDAEYIYKMYWHTVDKTSKLKRARTEREEHAAGKVTCMVMEPALPDHGPPVRVASPNSKRCLTDVSWGAKVDEAMQGPDTKRRHIEAVSKAMENAFAHVGN